MSSKAFRAIHGVKHRSPSSTFISLHFNKADEDQIEISYSDSIKDTDDPGTSESNFVCISQNSENASKPTRDDSSSKKDDVSNDSLFKGYLSRKKINSSSFNKGLEDATKDNFKLSESNEDDSTNISTSSAANSCQSTEFTSNFQNDRVDFNVTTTKTVIDSHYNLNLSPAIEAAELGDENVFDNYINDELSKAKCEIFKSKQTPSSQLKYSFPPKISKDDIELSEDSPLESQSDIIVNKVPQVTEGSTLFSVIKKCGDLLSAARNSMKFHILIAIFACLLGPIPSWLSGFLVGSILTSWLLYWLFPQKSTKSFLNYNFVETQNVEVSQVKMDSGIFKGWMNELPSFLSYQPEKYHVSCTRSLYVRLDGSYLRLSYPARNISKRAMFNEPRHELQFIHQQHYDITGATIELLPKGLASKRLWSKKYPISLKIQNAKEAVLSRQDGMDGSFFSKAPSKKEKFAPRINEDNEVTIYLFSRTDRDKNVWYHRFLRASKIKVARSGSPVSSSQVVDSIMENKRAMSVDFAMLQFGSSDPQSIFYEGNEEVDSFVEINMNNQEKFELYMSSLLSPLNSENPYSLSMFKKDMGDKAASKHGNHQSSNLMWLNTLMGRIFFDFLVDDIWAHLVEEKVQKKLNKLKLPFFLNELTVKEIHLGSALPKIHHASDPLEDERGLWVDLDLSYNGSFHMTLETKLKLKGGDTEELWSPILEQSETIDHPMKSPVYNSEEEDSAESSSDEDVPFPQVSTMDSLDDSGSNLAIGGGSSTGKKILKLVDRLAQSQYFQTATRNKYIKKAMADLSNVPLLLTVEVQWLTGTLALNIPPWPTDRLWYGFRGNPSLSLTARPMLGQKVVTLTHATEWIEKKLVSEFQKVLVMPNMDDLIIPIMQPRL